MVSELFIWTTLVLSIMLVEAPVSIIFWRQLKKYVFDYGKVWSIQLNSNTGLGKVQLIKPTKDGLKTKQGWEIPTEVNFAFKDTGPLTIGAPIFVWDGDTGVLVRPASGETEQADPSVKDAKNIKTVLNTIQQAGHPLPIIPALIIIGVVMIIGFAVIGFMLKGGGG